MSEIRDGEHSEQAGLAGKSPTQRSKLRLYFVTALMLALVVTGGMFAYAYTTASASVNATSGAGDFATVSNNNTMASYCVFGSYRGSIGSGTLFKVTTPTTNCTLPDIEVNVYLSNVDQLSKTYGMFLMRLKFVDIGGNYADNQQADKPLTLRNGVVTFICDNLTAGTDYYVKCDGGVYRAFPWAFLKGPYGPDLMCEAVQLGL